MKNIPQEVNEVLKEYFSLFESNLPNFIDGYYIYGSVSLGEFTYGVSDIDFIAVVKRKATDVEINLLKEIHSDIQKKFPEIDLMGLYILENDLKQEYENQNTSLCFIDGVYKGLEKFNKNSIDAYQVKKYGITIKGKDIDAFDYITNWDILITSMRDNLNTYWINWKNDCRKFLSIKYIGLFVSLDMIEWGVLGVSRLYYTFKEKDITSKVGAGEYVLKEVPERWHKIINEAMRLRTGNKKSYYRSIFKRRKDALEYIEFIIKESNNLFKEVCNV